MEARRFFYLDPFGPSRSVRGTFSVLKLVVKFSTICLAICLHVLFCRRFFRTRSNLLENDEINLENFEVQQLRKRVQYDAYNCGIYCLKVTSYVHSYIASYVV